MEKLSLVEKKPASEIFRYSERCLYFTNEVLLDSTYTRQFLITDGPICEFLRYFNALLTCRLFGSSSVALGPRFPALSIIIASLPRSLLAQGDGRPLSPHPFEGGTGNKKCAALKQYVVIVVSGPTREFRRHRRLNLYIFVHEFVKKKIN